MNEVKLRFGAAYTMMDIQRTYDSFLDSKLVQVILHKIVKELTGEDTKSLRDATTLEGDGFHFAILQMVKQGDRVPEYHPSVRAPK